MILASRTEYTGATMSNFTFLTQDKNILMEHHWFQILYERGREMESEFIRGKYNSFYHTAKTAMEYATSKYIEVAGITVKRRKKDKKRNNQLNSSGTFYLDAMDNENTDIAGGTLILRAYMQRQWNCDVMSNLDREDDRRMLECMACIHKYWLWIYNQITNQNIMEHFEENKMEVEYSEHQITRDMLKRVRIAGKEKVKGNKASVKAYQFVIVNGIMRIGDKEGNVIFSYTPTLYNREKKNYDKQQLVKSLVVANQFTAKMKELEEKIDQQVSFCKQENQQALRQIQIYAQQYGLEESQKHIILGRVSKLQQDENYALGIYMGAIHQLVKDLSNCVVELAKAIKMETSSSQVLHERMMELITHAQEIYDELSNTDIYGCYEWFGKKFRKMDEQMTPVSEMSDFTKNSSQQSYQFRINQATFHYAMETFLWEMREENFREDIASLWNEIDEEKAESAKQKEKNRKLKETVQSYNRTNTILKVLLAALLLVIGVLLCLWKMKWNNHDTRGKDLTQVDEEMLEKAMMQEDNADVDEDGRNELDEEEDNEDSEGKQLSEENSNNENDSEQTKLEETNEASSEEMTTEKKSEKKEDSMESTEKEDGKPEKNPEKEARPAYVQNGIFQDPTNRYRLHVPDGWNYYEQDGSCYLGASNTDSNASALYVPENADVSFEKMSLKYAKNDFGYDGDKDIYDVAYTICAGLPAIRITYWEGIETADSYEDAIVVKYYIRGAQKDYEFEFVEKDKSDAIYETSKTMMDSISFMQDERMEDATEQLLTKLTGDMLEAFYVRRDENDLSMFLTNEFYKNNRDMIHKVLFKEYDHFHYKIAIGAIGEDSASGTVETGADHKKTSVKNIQFQKVNDEWKISYYGK